MCRHSPAVLSSGGVGNGQLEAEEMETLRQRVVIPRSRVLRVTLNLPPSVPEGDADLQVTITSAIRQGTAEAILGLAGSLAGSPRLGGDPVAFQKAVRDEWS
jgi:hypothetical protein